MNLRVAILAGVLSTAIAHPVAARSPFQPVSTRARDLEGSPELMQCRLDRSQALWQSPHPISLGEIPCQYLGAVGGPASGGGSLYSPARLAEIASTVEIGGQRRIALRRIPDPRSIFEDRQTAAIDLDELPF
ncbi:hypothetical protein [Lyngbya confervoides]|uniref:Uncharacterized protein n=1 Tax=Lyngbya confervoides BDU141951 TaxID=1574623 RepID=A0ABD4T121_9CYAN|nr:hypothetical protein [Lyngbya confervoides]MCM1982060.1 hypothetical protein [Lyngbya confervoides BDU141951]